MKLTKDELEEQGLMEICKHCNSPYILDIDRGENVMCNDCGTVDYTKYVTEQEFSEIKESDTIV